MASAGYSPSVGSMPASSASPFPFIITPPVSYSWLNILTAVAVVVVSLLVLEQSVYRYKKGSLPGDRWTIPIIGRFADSLNPTLENYQRGWVFPLSVVSVFNVFIVMASSNEYSRKILTSAEYAEPCLVNSGKQIVSPDNWVFLHGKAHQDYRKGLNLLFTRRALAGYLLIQDRIYRQYFAKWLSNPSPTATKYQLPIRDLNMETSLRVFCGAYIPDDAAAEISDKYWLITQALELVNFPLALPGTKTYKAMQARKLILRCFEKASAESKLQMAAGSEPTCLIDSWVKAMIDSEKGDEEGAREVKMFSDREIAMVLFSFLFASQDAMSSAVCYAFQFMADHPDVFEKVREEQMRVRNGDVDSPMTLEHLDEMPYAKAFVKECLRIRPPVLMVPYVTRKAFPITDKYTIPKGSMCIPSFWNSLMDPEAYPEPDRFMPERWLPGGVSEKSPIRNYMVFGAGPHRCIGYDYAMMHIAAVIGTASILMNWEHPKTPESDVVKIMPTIFPGDELLLKFKPANLI